MGWDAYNTLPKGTREEDVFRFLEMLGYRQVPRHLWVPKGVKTFSFWRDDHYRYITGIYAEVYREHKPMLTVHTRTSIWRGNFDSEFHNLTIKELKRRFGGYFRTDYGRNRYFKFDGPVIEKAEGGCYAAYTRFHSNWQDIQMFLSSVNEAKLGFWSMPGIEFTDVHSPKIMASNLAIVSLVSLVEDYFRACYVALLRYSPRRAEVLKGTRVTGQDLVSVADGASTVEEAISKWMSFQDISKICQSFKELDPTKMDFAGVLRRPYRRRRESLFDCVGRIIRQRHDLIHRAVVDPGYTPVEAMRDADSVYVSVRRIYQSLIATYGWNHEHPDLGVSIRGFRKSLSSVSDSGVMFRS